MAGTRLRCAALAALLAGCAAATGEDGGHDAGDGGPADDGGRRIITPNTEGWWRGRVFYQVFVRSFFDADGDGVGDFKGLTARLDELGDGGLGVDGLWLMPIHPSPSYHGYDVLDYQGVNPQYGTMADFEAFLDAAHRRGMKVVLDFIPNHSSAQHAWFLDAGTRADWYVWRTDDPGWRRPTDQGSLWHPGPLGYYYGYFWSGMPDLNFRHPPVKEAMLAAQAFWLEKGVDGFRVDAARYLVEAADAGVRGISEQPETHEVFKDFRFALHRRWPQALFLAEVFASTADQVQYYGQGDEFQLAFAFDLAQAILASARKRDASDLINTIARNQQLFASLGVEHGYDAPFLTNHDQVRVMRQLEGDVGAARVAAATLFSLPGTPFVYYGEELGMAGGPLPRDEDKRTPMRWTAQPPMHGFTTRARGWYDGEAPEDAGVDVASQRADPGSLWNHYRRLIALRRSTPALALGPARWILPVGAPPSVFALERTQGASRWLYVANFSTAATDGGFSVAVPGATSGPRAAGLSEGLTGVPTVDGGALWVPGLGGRGWAYLPLSP